MTGSPRLAHAVSPRFPQATSLAVMIGFITALHVAGWGLLVSGRAVGGTSLGVGVGLTAYTLGLRHAFDADHIAAVDNTTRKLVGDGLKPVSVGFWFSLGHSTVVFALTMLLALGARALSSPLQDDRSRLHQVTGIVGTSVSGVFLYLIAAVNIGLLLGTWRLYRQARTGMVDPTRIDAHPGVGGPMSKLFGGIMKSIRKPWQMYPLGVLFGVGFDTATEVGLLVLATGSASAGVPWYSMLSLPLIFAAGMSLLDTADGVLMRYAYGWAYATDSRKLRYNLAITGLSVSVAVGVGTVELLDLATDRLHLDAWNWISGIDLSAVGPVTVAVFATMWLGAACIWKTFRLSRRTEDADHRIEQPAPRLAAEAVVLVRSSRNPSGHDL
ncbi:HoxN/HupN/NixA family nickel/cobalt transporter [Nocardia sp. NPDC052278]|uniref:HoxN/HupN/NixA family nickel/cobalt transporter n=1 Tax=unclassified Nocardia TaxID=2637762 RepID=UPI00369F342B